MEVLLNAPFAKHLPWAKLPHSSRHTKAIALRAAVFFAAIVAVTSSRAGLVEADWGPTRSWGYENFVFADGRWNFTARYPTPSTPPMFGQYGEAAQTWKGSTVTLSHDWSVQVRVHSFEFAAAWPRLSDIGVILARQNEPVLNQFHRFFNLSLRNHGNSQYYIMGSGSSVPMFESGDAILALSYSAKERIIRSYVRPLLGRFQETTSRSVQGWIAAGVGLSDPLEFSIFGA